VHRQILRRFPSEGMKDDDARLRGGRQSDSDRRHRAGGEL
jgi:hypothetical protein